MPLPPWSRELRGFVPARPGPRRLPASSCQSARSRDPRFFSTLDRPGAVAPHFICRKQLMVGIAPTTVRPCWAHTRRALSTPQGPKRPQRSIQSSKRRSNRASLTVSAISAGPLNRCPGNPSQWAAAGTELAPNRNALMTLAMPSFIRVLSLAVGYRFLKRYP